MHNEENKDLIFSDIYPIVVSADNDVLVMDLPFSVRLKNVLMRNHVTTLSAILATNVAEFEGFRNLGTKTVKELTDYLDSLMEEGSATKKETRGKIVKSLIIAKNIEAFLNGDRSFLGDITDDGRKTVEPYIEAYDTIGTELAELCYRDPLAVLPMVESLYDFIEKTEQEIEIEKRIKECINAIPPKRLGQKVIGYINAFTREEERIDKLKHIYSLDINTDAKLREFSGEIVFNSHQHLSILLGFLKWCSFDIKSEIDELFAEIYKSDNIKIALKGRASGKTLQEVGVSLGITRERIRQLESKAKRIFGNRQAKKRFLSKVSAIRNSDTILSSVELQEYFGEYFSEMIFLLRTYDSPAYKYDSQLDVFVLGDESLTSSAFEFVQSLPSSFDDSKYKEFVEMLEEKDIPLELFEKAFAEEYRKDGLTYHRIKQTLTEIYTLIMSTHFSHGISIYKESDMREFRRIAVEEYGCTKLPENDRAIYSRIQDICIMCDKGVYKPKAKEYVSKDLANKIHSYIVDSPATIFLTNVLFNMFEDELLAFGIDNKYYMQAVLRELYGNEFFFRRDYVSKDDTVTSIYAELVQYIKRFDYPITREDVYKEFPGLTDIVLNIAASDSDVLNLFGKYIHGSRLPLVDSDKGYFKSIINKYVEDDGICYYGDLYDYIVRDDEDRLRRLFINIPTSLFSVLEYLFRDEYQFKRPFIAKLGVEIGNPALQLKEMILSSDSISFAEIVEFMKENHCQPYSYLDYYNGYSDTHLLANGDSLATFDYLGIDDTVAESVVHILENSVSECMPIRDIGCIHNLPRINAPWNEWIIYSVIRKWSDKLEVGVSNSIFKLAFPLVSPKGMMNASEFGGQAVSAESAYKIDDLDNLDDLIADIIDLDEDL